MKLKLLSPDCDTHAVAGMTAQQISVGKKICVEIGSGVGWVTCHKLKADTSFAGNETYQPEFKVKTAAAGWNM